MKIHHWAILIISSIVLIAASIVYFMRCNIFCDDNKSSSMKFLRSSDTSEIENICRDRYDMIYEKECDELSEDIIADKLAYYSTFPKLRKVPKSDLYEIHVWPSPDNFVLGWPPTNDRYKFNKMDGERQLSLFKKVREMDDPYMHTIYNETKP